MQTCSSRIISTLEVELDRFRAEQFTRLQCWADEFLGCTIEIPKYARVGRVVEVQPVACGTAEFGVRFHFEDGTYVLVRNNDGEIVINILD